MLPGLNQVATYIEVVNLGELSSLLVDTLVPIGFSTCDFVTIEEIPTERNWYEFFDRVSRLND